MRLQPNRNYSSDDVVQTPPKLARQLVEHFNPRGRILEPCAGAGNFLRALRAHAKRGQMSEGRGRTTENGGRMTNDSEQNTASARGPSSLVSGPLSSSPSHVSWCEVQRGRDFFAWTERVDWIVTNPPWSQIRRFLQHAMTLADHVVFLMTINHVWTKARLRDIRAAGFGLREIVLVDMPPTFPQSGFQLGAVYVNRGWGELINLSQLAGNKRVMEEKV